MNTFRRNILDKYLKMNCSLMNGSVIDIGGKKEKKRGNFKLPLSQVKSWQYVNIDKATNPDFCCSAENIPVEDASYDTAILCEVLEHLEDPGKVVSEAFRILREGGALISSMPFMFPIHGDPCDYQRWTDVKIRSGFQSAGFTDIKIIPMGGAGSVIHDLLLVLVLRLEKRYIRFFGRWGLIALRPFFYAMDRVFQIERMRTTTGYFITATKKKQ